MLNFIYIGTDKETIERFSSTPDIMFCAVQNGVHAVKVIDRIREKLDIAILFESKEVTKDTSEIRILHKLFPGLYIVLVTEGLNKDQARSYLKSGISNTVSPKADKNTIQNIIDFLNIKKENQIRSLSVKAKKYQIFHLPMWKRTFDIVLSSFALICLSPIFLLTSIAIKLDSRGPVIYKSKRVGSNYKIFDCLKFRSMYTNMDDCIKNYADKNIYSEEEKKEAENSGNIFITDDNVDEIIEKGMEISNNTAEDIVHSEVKQGTILVGDDYLVNQKHYSEGRKEEIDNPYIKLKDDPRVTKVGHYIRKFSVDELPQLINIIKGDMSIVGNRPLPLYEAELLTSDEYVERFIAPAGLTGLWQVIDRGKKGATSSEERKRLDIQYAHEFSFKMDMKIILKTFTSFIQEENV